MNSAFVPKHPKQVRLRHRRGRHSGVALTLSLNLALHLTTFAVEGASAEHLNQPSSLSEGDNAERIELQRWLEPFTDTWLVEPEPAPDGRDEVFSTPFDIGTVRWTTGFDWIQHDWGAGRRYRFADARRFSLLQRYVAPSFEQYRSTQWLFAQTLDPAREPLVPELIWRLDEPNNEGLSAVGSLRGTRPESLPVVQERRCPRWAKPNAVLLSNWGSDYDRFPLIDCDGAIEPFAIDRISVLARAQSTPNPGAPLPADPTPSAQWPEEWVDGVRLLHPRLLWVVQQIGSAFPRRAIQIMSGYRRDPKPNSRHRQGRALDLKVSGVDNVALFAFCRTLKDVGCGFYPNHPFVHVDVRASGAKSVVWVDVSKPGEPSEYVDSWPGVIDSGTLLGTDTE